MARPGRVAGLAADDGRERLDDHAQDTDAQRNTQGHQVDRKKAIHDVAGIGENTGEIEIERHLVTPSLRVLK